MRGPEARLVQDPLKATPEGVDQMILGKILCFFGFHKLVHSKTEDDMWWCDRCHRRFYDDWPPGQRG